MCNLLGNEGQDGLVDVCIDYDQCDYTMRISCIMSSYEVVINN